MKNYLKKAESPVKKGFLLVCEKCGKKLAGNSEENPARTLQKALKEKVKAELPSDTIRPLVSSCMNVCPDGEITLAIVEDQAPHRFFTIPETKTTEEFDQLWSELKKLI